MKNLKVAKDLSLTAEEVNAEVDTGLEDYDASTGEEVEDVEDKVDIIDSVVDTTDDKVDIIDGIVDDLLLEVEHNSCVFPEDTDETVTFTAGGTNNIWSAWAELVDNNAVTLSSKSAAQDMHLSALMVEDITVKDVRFLSQISYGDAKTPITCHRYMGSTAKVGTTQHTAIRASHVPAGEKIYYRAKCETADAAVQVHLRYHLHPAT